MSGCKPSTSFRGSTEAATSSALICGGRGSWMSIPSIKGSLLSLSISSVSFVWLTVWSSLCSADAIPTLWQARRFPFMYEALAGSSPTRTTARQGGRSPLELRSAILDDKSSRISFASESPSTTMVSIVTWSPVHAVALYR